MQSLTNRLLKRHFTAIGARLKVLPPGRSEQKIYIDVRRDDEGEYFDVRPQGDVTPEVIDVDPARRHLVLMVRDGKFKNKFLLGHDERHWFAAAVPDDKVAVKDVKSAIESLRPEEVTGKFIRQGEWFFVPANPSGESPVLKNEPLSRGGGSKDHMCEYMMRTGGREVMVSPAHPTGISPEEYNALPDKEKAFGWRRARVDAKVYVRGHVTHADHATIRLDKWHEVFMNRERFARHAKQIVFLD
jgi:hypothetical protein